MSSKRIQIKLSGENDHTAYVRLPGYRLEPGVVSRTIRLDAILEYKGPLVNLDLDSAGRLIGIEVLVFDSDAAAK